MKQYHSSGFTRHKSARIVHLSIRGRFLIWERLEWRQTGIYLFGFLFLSANYHCIRRTFSMLSAHPASNLPPGVTPIPTGKLDLRAESEIVSNLLAYRPVTSEKNIWAFWDGGWGGMRPWTQRNVIAWMRRFEPSGWTVRWDPEQSHSYSESKTIARSAWLIWSHNHRTTSLRSSVRMDSQRRLRGIPQKFHKPYPTSSDFLSCTNSEGSGSTSAVWCFATWVTYGRLSKTLKRHIP